MCWRCLIPTKQTPILILMLNGQTTYILFSSNLSLMCISIESTYKVKRPTWCSWVRFMYDVIDGEKQCHRLRYSSFMIRTERADAIYSIKSSPSSIVCFKIMIVSVDKGKKMWLGASTTSLKVP